MPKPKFLMRTLTESPLIVLAIAVALLSVDVGPASGQFFNFGGPPERQQRGGGGGFGGGWFGNDIFAPFQQQVPRRAPPRPRQEVSRPPVREDFSRAPSPEKRETPAEHNVVVLGDGMADWLAYGLEGAYSDSPDMGVTRKHRTVSGLIRYQPKGDPADWPAAAKGILAAEKPDVVVVMLGFNDRIPMRDSKAEGKPDDLKKGTRVKPAANAFDNKTGAAGDAATKPSDDPDNAERFKDTADNADAPPPVVAPEKSARSPSGVYEFREQRWVELYTKKIDEMIGVVKSKGVPVIWVGLPSVRSVKDTADMLFLNSMYRDAAARAGITYVDVWEGFVDEGGRFMQQGPDFEGQTRRLRSSDGVFFTAAGARKLAHYVEREITRLLATRSAPITLPAEPVTPEANAQPGQPAPRPLAGPILPLVASSVGTDELLGGPTSRPVAVDALAARTLVKGEPLAAPAGRADDFSWPRREVGYEPAPAESPVASASPDKSKTVGAVAVVPPPKPRKPRPVHPASRPSQDFFGFDTAPQSAPPRAPRPVGRSAEVPGFFTR